MNEPIVLSSNTAPGWKRGRESLFGRVMVKRILRKHGYPPDKQEKATQTVLEQAQLLARDLAA